MKFIQILYQILYRLKNLCRRLFGLSYPLFVDHSSTCLAFNEFISKNVSYKGDMTFSFLNIEHSFCGNVDWNINAYGKLWAYNLNYMDYLLQRNMSGDTGVMLIKNFIEGIGQNIVGIEPYPISLRGENWIKFLSVNTCLFEESVIKRIKGSLYAQYKILYNNLEYNILANHLFENGISLLFGALYFKDERFYKKSYKLLNRQLNEQILEDGGHFELSTMYHRIILDRILDGINLLQNNFIFYSQKKLLDLMIEKAVKMLGWLNAMTFSNGDMPLLNDSATDIAPSSEELIKYSLRLGIPFRESRKYRLTDSGYRKYDGTDYECIIDVGPIGAHYQPGHAHADTFNFVVDVHGKEFVIDPGISTYENNHVRNCERGTGFHNTVILNNRDSSEIWSAFRVAKRAETTIVHEDPSNVVAYHNGYGNVMHVREWRFYENKIIIKDDIAGNKKIYDARLHILLSPEMHPVIKNDAILTENGIITICGCKQLSLLSVNVPDGYNKYIETIMVEAFFEKAVTTIIEF
ncbi:MAG: heparinase II/III family protein [Bacteroidales bacterium]|nr:heparinase II/III family protein [Bacteroidales bacterium]